MTAAHAPAAERVLLDADALARTLHRIAHEIIEANAELESVALVGIHTRGVPLAHRLRRLIEEFSGVEVALPVSSSLARGGRLTSMPTGIKCGQGATQCSIVEPRATAVELHASAAPGWRLQGWSNSSCGRHTDCTFLLPWPGGATAFFCAKADAKVCRRPAR